MPGKRLTKTISFILFPVIIILFSITLFPDHNKNIRIGVLAKRGIEKCMSKWSPTAEYLTKAIPDYNFEIIPLKFNTVKNHVKENKVDFVLCNSSFYVDMESDFGVSRIVTMRNLRGGKVHTRFAGVIFCLSKRKDIRNYSDLKNKKFLAVDKSSFGGWQMAYRELKAAGVDPFRNFKSIKFPGTHDAVVYGVLNGNADAGTVRTEILERMAAAGNINLNDFFILHEHKGDDHVPFLHSTRSYPEWPLAKVKHISDTLAKKVAAALMNIPEDSHAAKAAQYAGWTIPANYHSVHDCLRELKLGPYEDFGDVSFNDVIRHYWYWILIIMIFILFLSIFFSVVIRLNKKLKTAHDKLEDRVRERTQELELINTTLQEEIKEKVSLQEQLMRSQKLEAIGTLAGGIAHDFNNLLTVIGGHTQIVKMNISNNNYLYENISSIQDACELAGNLTRQLLTFSRKGIITPRSMNINDVILNLNKMVRRLIGEDININISLGDSIPLISADPGQIEQIIINLIVNANDAITAKGDITEEKNIKIETGYVNTNKEKLPVQLEKLQESYIYISVQDNGIGIEDKIKDKIFDPFFTGKGLGHRTGLGLATVYGIIKQNSGGIHFESEPGEGSTFTVYWPGLGKSSKSQSFTPEPKEQIVTGDEHILFVEDNNKVRDLTTTALESFGYKVNVASNGIEALNLIKTKNLEFDLLLTDLVMPKMNGKKLAERVKDIFPGIIILFTSGYTDKIVSPEIISSPDADFIHKPYSLSELSQKIRFLLDSNKK
ncbi:MAG: PhnD/SsuA/transferrin family substrate-binding protein [Acidobacteriota bacterium]